MSSTFGAVPRLLALVVGMAVAADGSHVHGSVLATFAVDGSPPQTIELQPAGSAPNGAPLFGAAVSAGGVEISWSYSIEVFPNGKRSLNGKTICTNMGDNTPAVESRVEWPLCPELAGSVTTGGTMSFSLFAPTQASCIWNGPQGWLSAALVDLTQVAAFSLVTGSACPGLVIPTSMLWGTPIPSKPYSGPLPATALAHEVSVLLGPAAKATLNINIQALGTASTVDSDGDGVIDCLDLCPGFDDFIDLDGNGTPDGCDASPCPGDLDDDGTVAGADLGLLLAAWGPCSGCGSDLDGNGHVDGADLGTLLGAWGACP